jgi:hypothetical protein
VKSSTLNADPKRARPATDTAVPNLAKLRKATQLPRFTQSSTDSENNDPKRAKPTTDTALPSRAKLRNDSELPISLKSSTAKALPQRPTPNNDTALLIRA